MHTHIYIYRYVCMYNICIYICIIVYMFALTLYGAYERTESSGRASTEEVSILLQKAACNEYFCCFQVEFCGHLGIIVSVRCTLTRVCMHASMHHTVQECSASI